MSSRFSPSLPPLRPSHWLRRARRVAGALACAAALAACGPRDAGSWHLADVSGHLPDLSFALTRDNGQPVTASAFHGDVALVFFGYTHCPDICPETMARLMQVLAALKPGQAEHVRILFVSVDPARDTPDVMHAYTTAFDPQHAVGLTGSSSEIEALARRYRVAYQAAPPDARGDYEVSHSAAVYVFDEQGHARLLATQQDPPAAIAADLSRLIGTG